MVKLKWGMEYKGVLTAAVLLDPFCQRALSMPTKWYDSIYEHQ